MKEFFITMSIMPNSALTPEDIAKAHGGVEGFNKAIKEFNFNTHFWFTPEDSAVEVVFRDKEGNVWGDELPNEVAEMLWVPNVPVEHPDYCKRLRFPSHLPARSLKIFSLGPYDVDIRPHLEMKINLMDKQVPFGNIKTFEEMLNKVTK